MTATFWVNREAFLSPGAGDAIASIFFAQENGQ